MHESPYNARGKKKKRGGEMRVRLNFITSVRNKSHYTQSTPRELKKKKMKERTHYVAFTTTFIMCNSHRRWTEQKKKRSSRIVRKKKKRCSVCTARRQHFHITMKLPCQSTSLYFLSFHFSLFICCCLCVDDDAHVSA